MSLNEAVSFGRGMGALAMQRAIVENPFTMVGVDALGQDIDELFVHVSDRSGQPFPGIEVRVAEGDKARDAGHTDSTGTVKLRAPFGGQVSVLAVLPEGMATRVVPLVGARMEPVQFHSTTPAPKPAITVAEIIAFVLGGALVAAGAIIKDGKTDDVLLGVGSSVIATSTFSVIFRHLR